MWVSEFLCVGRNTCELQDSRSLEDGAMSLGVRLQTDVNHQIGCWKQNSGPLQEQHTRLTAELPLHLLSL